MDRHKKSKSGDIDNILERKLGRMMRTMSFPRMTSSYFSTWQPGVDIYESDDEIIVYMEVPGVAVEEIKVIAESKKLIISGDRKCPISSINSVHQLEIDYGPFRRVIDLPVAVDVSATTSSSKDGFLIVKMPLLKAVGRVDIQLS